MADTFHFELISPERRLITAELAEVVIPGQEGDFTAMPNHAPFISALRPGILRIPSLNGREARFYLRGGFAEVTADETVVLAELALPLEEFSAERLRDELALAEQAHEEAADEMVRFRTIDVVERLRSLQIHVGAGAIGRD
jgi:F-type H+-transporting ATPase subunit epsilon